jgi:hypothetical protein
MYWLTLLSTAVFCGLIGLIGSRPQPWLTIQIALVFGSWLWLWEFRPGYAPDEWTWAHALLWLAVFLTVGIPCNLRAIRRRSKNTRE